MAGVHGMSVSRKRGAQAATTAFRAQAEPFGRRQQMTGLGIRGVAFLCLGRVDSSQRRSSPERRLFSGRGQ